MEHEELQMSVQRHHQNVRPTLTAVQRASMEQYHGVFSQVKTLPLSFSIKADKTVSLYRARVDNRNVILRVLKGTVPLKCCISSWIYFTSCSHNKYTLHVHAEIGVTLQRSQCSLYYIVQYSEVQCSTVVLYLLLINISNVFFLRNGKQQWEAAFFGICVLPIRIGATPFLTYTARYDFSATTTDNGDGGAAAPRPAWVPVEVSTGRSCLLTIIDFSAALWQQIKKKTIPSN